MRGKSIGGRARFLLAAALAALLISSPAWVRGAPRVGEIVRVKVNVANVREGPGTHFERLWRAPRNYPYKVIDRNGKWLKVQDFDGYREWIYGPLTDGKSAVVVKVDRANVRRGAGTNFPILFQAKRGSPFRVLRTRGRWLNVRRAGGKRGWIFEELVWGKIP